MAAKPFKILGRMHRLMLAFNALQVLGIVLEQLSFPIVIKQISPPSEQHLSGYSSQYTSILFIVCTTSVSLCNSFSPFQIGSSALIQSQEHVWDRARASLTQRPTDWRAKPQQFCNAIQCCIWFLEPGKWARPNAQQSTAPQRPFKSRRWVFWRSTQGQRRCCLVLSLSCTLNLAIACNFRCGIRCAMRSQADGVFMWVILLRARLTILCRYLLHPCGFCLCDSAFIDGTSSSSLCAWRASLWDVLPDSMQYNRATPCFDSQMAWRPPLARAWAPKEDENNILRELFRV